MGEIMQQQAKGVEIRITQSFTQLFDNIRRVIGLMPAKYIIGLIDELDLEANPRNSRLGPVTAAIQESISQDERTGKSLFPLKSKGILIAASSYEMVDGDGDRYRLRFEDPATEGILDGGHNTLAIGAFILAEAERAVGKPKLKKKDIQIWEDFKQTWCNRRADIDLYLDRIRDDRKGLLDEGVSLLNFFVPVELLLPASTDDKLCLERFRTSLLEICAARNNNAQLTEGTKGNKEGLFDSFRSLFEEKHPDLAGNISWKTNDGGKVESKTLIALAWIPLSLSTWVQGDERIVEAPKMTTIYSGKETCLKRYLDLVKDERISISDGAARKELKDSQVLSALAIATDLPDLFDRIYKLFPGCYRGSYGKMSTVKKLLKKGDEYQTPFYGRRAEKPVPDGFIYPLVCALRAIMKYDSTSNRIVWMTDPRQFVESNEFKNAIGQYSGIIQQLNYDPQKVGKGAYSYSSIEDSVELAYRSQQAR